MTFRSGCMLYAVNRRRGEKTSVKKTLVCDGRQRTWGLTLIPPRTAVREFRRLRGVAPYLERKKEEPTEANIIILR